MDAARVGVLGHSEGGIYTASLIEAGEKLAFAVGMVSPATNGVDLLIAQSAAIVRSGGSPESEVTACRPRGHPRPPDRGGSPIIARDERPP